MGRPKIGGVPPRRHLLISRGNKINTLISYSEKRQRRCTGVKKCRISFKKNPPKTSIF
jgi:hypothetical protein